MSKCKHEWMYSKMSLGMIFRYCKNCNSAQYLIRSGNQELKSGWKSMAVYDEYDLIKNLDKHYSLRYRYISYIKQAYSEDFFNRVSIFNFAFYDCCLKKSEFLDIHKNNKEIQKLIH